MKLEQKISCNQCGKVILDAVWGQDGAFCTSDSYYGVDIL